LLRSIPKDILDAVRAIPLFSTCDTRELREIARLGTRASVSAGNTIVAEGKPGRELLVILDGKATCRVKGKKLAHFGPGEFFGEMSLLDKGSRSATVIADSDMELLVLDGQEFRSLIEASPGVAWKMLVVMAGRLRGADESLSY
jgi:CRP/FNR family cyclic AMP-dependent transcriptional regulator